MNDIQLLKFLEKAIIAVMACFVVGVAALIIAMVYQFEMARQESVIIPAPPQQHGPDIRHCLEPGVDLWTCIRNAEYEKEKASG